MDSWQKSTGRKGWIWIKNKHSSRFRVDCSVTKSNRPWIHCKSAADGNKCDGTAAFPPTKALGQHSDPKPNQSQSVLSQLLRRKREFGVDLRQQARPTTLKNDRTVAFELTKANWQHSDPKPIHFRPNSRRLLRRQCELGVD